MIITTAWTIVARTGYWLKDILPIPISPLLFFVKNFFISTMAGSRKAVVSKTDCLMDTIFDSPAMVIHSNIKYTNWAKLIKEQQFGTKDAEEVFTTVQTAPSFPGGDEAWTRYISNNLHYPASLKEKITGKVFVSFIVDREGFVADIMIIRSLHPLLDEEAMKLIKKSPRWNPAMQNGKAIASSIHIPVSFR